MEEASACSVDASREESREVMSFPCLGAGLAAVEPPFEEASTTAELADLAVPAGFEEVFAFADLASLALAPFEVIFAEGNRAVFDLGGLLALDGFGLPSG